MQHVAGDDTAAKPAGIRSNSEVTAWRAFDIAFSLFGDSFDAGKNAFLSCIPACSKEPQPYRLYKLDLIHKKERSVRIAAKPPPKAKDADAIIEEYEKLRELEKAVKQRASEEEEKVARQQAASRVRVVSGEEEQMRRENEERKSRAARMQAAAVLKPGDPGPYALTKWRDQVDHLTSPFSSGKNRRLTPPSSQLSPRRIVFI